MTGNLSPEYINEISAKARALLDIEYKGRKFQDYGSYWFNQIGLSGTSWLERMEQLKDAQFKWPIPFDVATYEILQEAGYIK